MENKTTVLTLDSDESIKKKIEELEVYQSKVSSKQSVIDNMLFNHKNDVDNTLFESNAWKAYNHDLDTITFEYSRLKNSFTKVLMPIVAKELNLDENDLNFTWRIDNFEDYEVIIDY